MDADVELQLARVQCWELRTIDFRCSSMALDRRTRCARPRMASGLAGKRVKATGRGRGRGGLTNSSRLPLSAKD